MEDNENDLELVLRALKGSGLLNRVHTVRDGKAALDYIYQNEVGQVPHAILLDLKLPKVSGIDVLKKLKSDERTKSIPVVILTSSKEVRDLKECYDLGVNSYIVKPFGLDEFIKQVSAAGMYWLVVNQPPDSEN